MDLHVFAVEGIPEVTRDVDLAELIAGAVTRERRRVEDGDIFVVAQKIVSKAEGAVVQLDEVTPSAMAAQWAADHGKDARVVEVVLRESRRIVRMDRDILITETRHGFVCADSEEARAQASALIDLLPGLRPVNVGPLARARHVEHLTALAIAVNRRHKIHDARFRVVGLP